MSESTETKEESPEAAAPAPSGKGGKIAIILAAVNFLAVLGLGGYMFYTQQHAAAQGKKAAGGDHGDKKDEHGEAAEGGHGEAAEGEGHGEAAEGHGEPAAEEGGGHGAAKAEGHGEAKGGGGHGGGHGGGEAETASVHSDELAGRGPLLALDPLVTNLAGSDSDRYLKVTMQVRISTEAAKAEVEANLVPVRNQLLLYLSSLTMEDTVGAENKREIQKRVKRIANEAMPSSRISQVYFTEFVIQ